MGGGDACQPSAGRAPLLGCPPLLAVRLCWVLVVRLCSEPCWPSEEFTVVPLSGRRSVAVGRSVAVLLLHVAVGVDLLAPPLSRRDSAPLRFSRLILLCWSRPFLSAGAALLPFRSWNPIRRFAAAIRRFFASWPLGFGVARRPCCLEPLSFWVAEVDPVPCLFLRAFSDWCFFPMAGVVGAGTVHRGDRDGLKVEPYSVRWWRAVWRGVKSGRR
ncbi:uncharacterized protein G2W53_009630 [Senna tora]|uniref:Secreted protein n=1 Tax=Senna tora TaxID=362788 RepID=A0A834WYF7_9FABA|nr:uncharacterized protein G2W53_009630 [Senna tora]